jgi:L-ascorbate 6-phosphate lactonase
MNYVYKSGESLRSEMLATVVPSGAVAIWNLGQAGVVIKGPDTDAGLQSAIVIDPYLTRSIERNSPGTEFVREYDPPLCPTQLAGVSAVLVTHEHDDHLDLDTIRDLHRTSPQTRVGVPAPHVHLLFEIGVGEDSVVPTRAGELQKFGDLEVLPIAAAHTEYRTDEDGNHHYLGYVVRVGGVRVFHSGDTLVTAELVETVRQVRPHITILPINGCDYERSRRGIVGNMSAREALDFAKAVGADLLIPVHYDMFPNNRDNPAYLVDYWFQHHRDLKFHMMTVGERFIYLP